MAGEAEPPAELTEVLDGIRATVAARRAAGEYPADLEERLGGHFDRIRRLRAEEDRLEPVRLALEELERRTQFSLAHNTTSRNPLGERYHRLMAEAISRQVEPLVGQVRSYVDQLREVFASLVERLDDPGSHVHTDLLGQIDAALDRLGQLHAMPADPQPPVSDRTDTAPVRVAESTWGDAADLRSFRLGTRAQLEGLLAPLIPQLGKLSGPALGIDVGRGEMMSLLARIGLTGECWERAQGRPDGDAGGPARLGDGLEALVACDPGSLGTLVLPDPSDQLRLADAIALAATRLGPDGHVLITGVDPDATGPLGRHLRADPRHPDRIYPETVELLCRRSSFVDLVTWQGDGTTWGRTDRGLPAPDQVFAVLAGR